MTGRSLPAAPAHKAWRRWARAVAFSLAALVLAASMARAILFTGPYAPPQPLPPGKLLDIHAHTAGIGAGGSGCFISKDMEASWKLDVYLGSFGTSRAELQKKGDAIVLQRMSQQLARSRYVGRAIVLAMDGVLDARGELDRARTEVYVPNEFLARETAKTPNLLFGASIHPLRKDALQRLTWAKQNGAKLVKWIPSVMRFDPADRRLVPFYEKLVELDLPLLTHTGQERSFTGAVDALCDPERLRLPLSLGVTVIAAHIASTGENAGERDTDRLARMMPRYPNLYSEISSLTQINKLGYLRESILRPAWKGRLLFGSDFPLINTALVSPYYYPLQLSFGQQRAIAALDNPWDRDVALKQALGVPRDVFERAQRLIR